MEALFDLVLPTIAILILTSIIDQITKFLEVIIAKIPHLPDEFEWYIGYAIVLSLSFAVTSNGNFDLFSYFGFNFKDPHVGYFVTALVISGGSTFIKEQIALLGSFTGLVHTLSPKKNKEDEE